MYSRRNVIIPKHDPNRSNIKFQKLKESDIPSISIIASDNNASATAETNVIKKAFLLIVSFFSCFFKVPIQI